MAETCDLAVIGLGALGSSTAWHAASRGMRVVGLEAFEFGHDRGASHDTSRIIRHSYHTPAYVALTFGAYDEWARLEEETGEQFVTVTGGLDLFPPDAQIPMDDYTSSMDAHDIAYDVLDVGAVEQRWPAFVAARRDRSRSIRPAPESCLPPREPPRWHGVRSDLGAVLHYDTRVEAIVPGADGVDVVTADGVISAGRVVVTADAWTAESARPARRRPAADRHRGAGHLLRSGPACGLQSRTCSRCGSGWTSRPTTASPPTARRPSRPPRTAADPP